MAKAFGEHERNMIRGRLVEAAERSLCTKGIQATTVDELAAAAGISKGAFYQFYPSKELLFFAVIMAFHEKIEGALISSLEGLAAPGPKELAGLMLGVFRDLSHSFFPRLFESGELEVLMRRLPPELVAEHHGTDDDFFTHMASALPALSGLETRRVSVWAAALRAIFLSMLHRREIGEELFDDALAVLVEGVVERMFNEAQQGGTV